MGDSSSLRTRLGLLGRDFQVDVLIADVRDPGDGDVDVVFEEDAFLDDEAGDIAILIDDDLIHRADPAPVGGVDIRTTADDVVVGRYIRLDCDLCVWRNRWRMHTRRGILQGLPTGNWRSREEGTRARRERRVKGMQRGLRCDLNESLADEGR